MVVIRMESRLTERTKSEKVKFVHKSGYIKQIKQALVLRRKKLFQNIKNSGELLLIQEIRRTVGNSGDPRKDRETWTICVGHVL